MSGFYNLDVPLTAETSSSGDIRFTKLYQALFQCRRLGYDVVAVSLAVPGGRILSSHIDRITSTVDSLKRAFAADAGGAEAARLGEPAVLLDADTVSSFLYRIPAAKEFRVLTRLNVSIDLPQHVQAYVQSMPLLQSIDLVALKVSDEKCFFTIANSPSSGSSIDCDLFCFDVEARLPFFLKMPVVKQILARDVFFEIPYGLAVSQTSLEIRSNVFNNANQISRAVTGSRRRSKGFQELRHDAFKRLREDVGGRKSLPLVISCGCADPLAVRNPTDVGNLAISFGMASRADGMSCISHNADMLLRRAVTRRTWKGAVSVSLKKGPVPMAAWQTQPEGEPRHAAAKRPSASGNVLAANEEEEKDNAGPCPDAAEGSSSSAAAAASAIRPPLKQARRLTGANRGGSVNL